MCRVPKLYHPTATNVRSAKTQALPVVRLSPSATVESQKKAEDLFLLLGQTNQSPWKVERTGNRRIVAVDNLLQRDSHPHEMIPAKCKPIRITSMASSVSTGSKETRSSISDSTVIPYAQRYKIRLYAANLPPRSLLRGRDPDTMAVVTSPAKIDDGASKLMHPAVTTSAAALGSSNLGNPEDKNETGLHHNMEKWGQTEVVHSSRHPQWTTTIVFDYVHAANQKFYVHLFSASPELKSYGTALYHVNDILANPRRTRVRRLRTGGCLFCRLEPDVTASHPPLWFQWQAHNLPRSRRPLVLEVAQRQPDTQSWLTVYRSAPTGQRQRSSRSIHSENDTTSLSFDPIMETDLGALCGGDINRPLRCTIRRGTAGWSLCETTLHHIRQKQQTAGTAELTLVKDASRVWKDMGRLCVTNVPVDAEDDTTHSSWSAAAAGRIVEVVDLEQRDADFAAAVEKEGVDIEFCVAIDFTSSNGNPMLEREDSYHHLGNDGSMNDYEETITAIGSAMEKYSKSQDYFVWGFGAKYGGKVRHCFQCGPTATAKGVNGILEAYRSVFQRDLVMSGPTVFTKVIHAAGAKAHQARNTNSYRVLLIVTDDGHMENYVETRNLLQLYEDDPLSVVFVGVGRSDFAPLHRLCRETPRTTFVEFREHDYDPAALGEAALQKLPSEVCDYRRRK